MLKKFRMRWTVIVSILVMGIFPSAAMAKKHHHKKHHHHRAVPVYVAPKPQPAPPKPVYTPPPAPQTPQGPLSLSAAGSAAQNHAQSLWASQLPSYSSAYDLPFVDSNTCLTFGTYSVHCVVSIHNSNYNYDPYLGFMDGYAYCVGTVYVTENQWTGSLSTTDEPGTVTCDSTYDF